jgi:DnaJ-domain-containing protein 1
VSGSDWKLAPEGQAAGRGQQEPKFSTWEEVRQKQERRRLGLDDDDSTNSGGSGATRSGGGDKSASSADSAFYALLGVPPSASQADIKTAYRQLALKLHPDVNSDEDAAQRFAAVANAYDTLSDVDARKLYDRYGAEGMKRHTGWFGLCVFVVVLCGVHPRAGQPATGAWPGAGEHTAHAHGLHTACRLFGWHRQCCSVLGRVQAAQAHKQAQPGTRRQHSQLQQCQQH